MPANEITAAALAGLGKLPKNALGFLVYLLLQTTVGDDLAQKKAKEYLAAIGRPAAIADQAALLGKMKEASKSNNPLLAMVNSFRGKPTPPDLGARAAASQAAYDANQGVIQGAFNACQQLHLELDGRLAGLDENVKKHHLGLANELVLKLQPLVQDTPPMKKVVAALAGCGFVGGALYLMWTAEEQAFKIRPNATVVMWAVEIMALLLSATGTVRQFWDAFVMRLGIGVSTYLLAIVQLYVAVDVESRAVKAAAIIPNLLALIAYLIFPRARSYWKDCKMEKTLKRYRAVNLDAGSGGAVDTSGLLDIVAALENFDAVTKQEETDNPADNKTVANVTAANATNERLLKSLRQLAGMPAKKNEWNLAAKISSIVYGQVVSWAQFFSSIDNLKVLADTVPFVVLIAALTVESTFSNHSAGYMRRTIVRYSGGMFFSLFTFSRYTLDKKFGPQYFNNNPDFARNMAFTTTFLMLTVSKQLVPLFEQVLKLFQASTYKKLNQLLSQHFRDTAQDDIPLSADAEPRVTELKDENFGKAEHQNDQERRQEMPKRRETDLSSSTSSASADIMSSRTMYLREAATTFNLNPDLLGSYAPAF